MPESSSPFPTALPSGGEEAGTKCEEENPLPYWATEAIFEPSLLPDAILSFCSGRVTGRNPNSSQRAWAVKLWAVAQNRLVQPPRNPRSPVSRWLSPSPLTSVWGHPDAEHDFKATLGPLMPVMVTPHHTPRRKSQHQPLNLKENLDSFSPLSLLY